MNTLHLRYALEVARTGSITQAADNLFMGQPNLSKAIRELEDALGLSIFRRTSKGVVPTEKGTEFLKYAARVLREVEQMEALGRQNETDAGHFRAMIPRAGYLCHAALGYLSAPDSGSPVAVQIEERDAMSAAAAVAGQTCDLAVLRYSMAHEPYFLDFFRSRNLSFEPIWEFEPLVVLSGVHPHANDQELTEAALAGDPEVTFGEDAVPYLNGEDHPRPDSEDRKPPHSRLTVSSCPTAYDLLSRLPSAYLRESPAPPEWLSRFSLVQRRLAGSAHKKDVLIYPRGARLGEKEHHFIDCVFEAKNRAALREYR